MVDRNQATNLTMIIGIVYLMYSAYFLSSELIGMTQFVNFILAFLYFAFGIGNHRALKRQILLLK